MISKSQILKLWIDNLSFKESLDKIVGCGLKRQSGFVCFANVHMAVEAYRDPSFNKELRKATLILPDGKPLALACNWLYKKKQERIAGMDFMPALLQQAHKLSAKIFLFGSTQLVLNNLVQEIAKKYPRTQIAGMISPPFKELSDEEMQKYINHINNSGAHFVFVSLGCPKQEKWMAKYSNSISAILLGVGGAFSVVANIQRRAPKWMRQYSLEWLYRLCQEPTRLFRRYFVTNSIFIFLILKQWLFKPLLKVPKY